MNSDSANLELFFSGPVAGRIARPFSDLVSKRDLVRIFEDVNKENQVKNENTVRVDRGGAYSVSLGEIPAFARVYKRGGFVSFFQDDFFLKIPLFSRAERPFEELFVTTELVDAKVSVARPIAALIKWIVPGLIYRGIIFTEAVKGSTNLLEFLVSEHEEKRGQDLCYVAGQQAHKAILAGVLHKDLHPGNVLFCEDSRGVFLIDFDKAKRITKSNCKPCYMKYLINRWSKSIKKHRLSQSYVKAFGEGLLG